jgi:multiple sugar transport system ATP-binding protein
MAQVVLEHLTRRFPGKNGPDVVAVDDLNLTIADGEFMVLVGPSGCGKSTTLRMIAGLEEISDGTITIDGRLVNEVSPKDRDIAMVFQNYALYPHMTVRENMAFGLRLRKFPQGEIDIRVRDAAGLLGLETLLDRRPGALSGGQRQRVAVGRAIVRRPRVFLFDEPLSNLDARMRLSTRAELSTLHQRLGTTIIYVTHDQVEAVTMGDRICVMKDGRIMQVDGPRTVYERPANLFVAGFIGSPPMNQFPGILRAQGGQVRWEEDGAGPTAVALKLPETLARRGRNHADRPVVLGIRPEAVRLATSPEPGRTREATVILAEPLGAETWLHLRAGTTSFTARVAPAARYHPGQQLLVGFDLEQAHLFDATSGQAII